MAAAADDYLSYVPLEWHPYFDRRQPNLESHQLFWLDERIENIDDDAILSTLTKFRRLVNYTKAFDHWRTCLKHIQKSDTHTFLVCSASYAKSILPEVWSFRPEVVWKVYVYYEEEENCHLECLECCDKVSSGLLGKWSQK
jgi:hypothetical protein